MLTTKRDIFAWALIALAAEPYVVSVLGTYTPILLEQLARENGVLESDHLTPCTAFSSPPGNEPIPNPPPPDQFNAYQDAAPTCVLPLWGNKFYIDTSSYALYTFSFSVLIQTICVLTISGIADNSNYKKRLIVFFGIFGGISTSCFFFVDKHNYYMASILAILANSSFGCINVLMNSYLTILIKHYPFGSVMQNNENLFDDQNNDNDDDDLSMIDDDRLGNVGSKISGVGTSTGYIAALIIQLSSLVSLNYLKNINPNVIWCIKIIISAIGSWWLVWQIPIAIYLRNLCVSPERNLSLNLQGMIKKGYKDLAHAMFRVRELKDIYFFLLGWFVLSDSITTINSTAILFAKTNLNMPMVSLAKIGVLVMVSAITGSIVIPNVIIGHYGWDLQHVLIGLILWCLCVPIYGIIALNSKYEMYLLGMWYGIGLGGLNTVSRSIYSIIIPKGKESIFFSIFSLTDKTSSIIGPFVVGFIINIFHGLRGAFWVLALLLIISIPILSKKFNLGRARLEAELFN